MKAFIVAVGIALISIICLVVVGIGYYVGTRNSLVNLRETVNSDWGKVEVVCQRRNDVIPNLVATVKGYASHEKDLLKSVADARSKAGQVTLNAGDITKNPELLTKFMDAQKELSGALTRLLAVSENYPTLKADRIFLELQAQIEGAENRISVERLRAQNDTQAYNTLVGGTISRLVAGSEFKRIEYFAADEAAKTAPKVAF